jgi:hypothetical protein
LDFKAAGFDISAALNDRFFSRFNLNKDKKLKFPFKLTFPVQVKFPVTIKKAPFMSTGSIDEFKWIYAGVYFLSTKLERSSTCTINCSVGARFE